MFKYIQILSQLNLKFMYLLDSIFSNFLRDVCLVTFLYKLTVCKKELCHSSPTQYQSHDSLVVFT